MILVMSQSTALERICFKNPLEGRFSSSVAPLAIIEGQHDSCEKRRLIISTCASPHSNLKPHGQDCSHPKYILDHAEEGVDLAAARQLQLSTKEN